MDKEKEIEGMIEVLKNKHFEKNLDEYIADIPRAICSALVEAGYRKVNEVRKEAVKEILQELYPYIGNGLLFKKLERKYGVEVTE